MVGQVPFGEGFRHYKNNLRPHWAPERHPLPLPTPLSRWNTGKNTRLWWVTTRLPTKDLPMWGLLPESKTLTLPRVSMWLWSRSGVDRRSSRRTQSSGRGFNGVRTPGPSDGPTRTPITLPVHRQWSSLHRPIPSPSVSDSPLSCLKCYRYRLGVNPSATGSFIRFTTVLPPQENRSLGPPDVSSLLRWTGEWGLASDPGFTREDERRNDGAVVGTVSQGPSCFALPTPNCVVDHAPFGSL